MDLAAEALGRATSIVQLARRAHWHVPRYLCGVVPYQLALTNSAPARMLVLYPGEEHSLLYRTLHAAAAPFRWFTWRTFELMYLLVRLTSTLNLCESLCN
jgi:hypothetical protein